MAAASSDPQHPDMQLLPITARSSDTGWLNTVDTNSFPLARIYLKEQGLTLVAHLNIWGR